MSTEYATIVRPEIDDLSTEQTPSARTGLRAAIARTAIWRALTHQNTHETSTSEATEVGNNPQTRLQKLGKIGLVTGLSASMIMGTGVIAERTHYDKPTTVEAVVNNPIDTWLDKNQIHEQFKDASWLVVPGFNMSWFNSSETAKTLDKSLGETGEMAWVGFSDRELSVDSIFNKTLEYIQANDIKEVRLYGCSFGGMLSIELAIRLQQAGVEVPTIVLDSSPATGDDVIDQSGLKWASSPLMGPIPYGARKSFDQHGFNLTQMYADIRADFATSNDITRLSSTVVGQQARYIQQADIADLGSQLSLDTKIIYIGSQGDQTINTEQAYGNYQAMFKDRDVEHYSSTGASHASPIGDKKIYTPILTSIADKILPHELPDLLLPNMPR